MFSTIKEDIIIMLQQNQVEQAVKNIYEYYFDGIVQYIKMNGGTADDGSDIFQETVLVVMDKVQTGKFRGESSLKTFIFAVARNHWLHHLRTKTRRDRREKIYSEGANEIEDNVIYTRVEQIPKVDILQIMNQIGEQCKSLLTSFYYKKKKMKDILEDFSFENEQVLRNKKSKCMKKLKELIQANPTILASLKSQI